MTGKCLTRLACFLLAVLPTLSLRAEDAAWIRPKKAGDPLVWGRKDGIVFGLPSAGGMPGPRGLLRVGTFDSKTGKPELLNFIAVEPVVEGKKARGYRMAFSELEKSRVDKGKLGASLWVGGNGDAAIGGTLERKTGSDKKAEVLSVRVEIEAFPQNHAHLYLMLSVESDHPGELHLSAYPYHDSKPLNEVVFTATMGAYERLRCLWLRNLVVDSRSLYSGYNGYDFAEHDAYPLEEMLRDSNGDAIALATSSEAAPAAGRNPEAKANWYYPGLRLTQYWKVPAKEIQPNLRVRVNGRHTYWKSKDAIPGGTTFENFELRQKFHPGQTFVFGIAGREPAEWAPPLTGLGGSPKLE